MCGLCVESVAVFESSLALNTSGGGGARLQLHWACRDESLDTARVLLEEGGANAQVSSGASVVILAEARRSLAVAAG